ncbi:TRAUB-domain-containing protein [Polyplosphaeria fusca]|uniref:Protein BFR2 n=1 Tax=Polyplosphaeria fusca TaxID=682080 RepID=A0A9P4QRB5_9PLEO|nr:TRAUB-domain-containing protein [Polyplosphaeria fusca]
MGKKQLRDFDPEALLDPAPSSSDEGSDFSSDEDAHAGREHYADVSKSKLRKKEVVPLGPQYTGSRISRDVVEDEDSDDPFAKGRFDVEEESESEDELITNGNGVALDSSEEDEGGSSGLGEAGFESSEEIDGIDDEDDESGSDLSDDDEDADEARKLRAMMAEGEEDDDDDEEDEKPDKDYSKKVNAILRDQSAIAAPLATGAKVDVAKGEAVKQQKKDFDSLLNIRIRLQKALISTNSMAHETYQNSSAPEDSIMAAENAALQLLNNLSSLRSTLDSARTGEKRKRPATFDTETSSTEIWSDIQASETAALPKRHTTLEFWSKKSRGAVINSSRGRLNSSVEQTFTQNLQSQLTDPSHHILKTQTPRSCAPLQAASSMPPSKDIYDDADFYGLLLKDLLESHSSNVSNGNAAEFIVSAPWQVAREAKTKKVVDTKASKGRRLRYTVHEKLQNFMAPEDRGTWAEMQRDELFSSLFGRRLELGEDAESEEDGEEDREAEGLMLFRS